MATLEILVIGMILLLQIYAFIIALKRILVYSEVLPSLPNLGTKTINNISKGSSDQVDDTIQDNLTILTSKNASKNFSQIETSINKYIIKNSGSASNFDVLKNVIERNIEKLENEISLMTPLPLYLGLMGTLLGIIIGLWNLPSTASTEFLDGNGIDILINGVKIAMIASLAGLVLTTINGGWAYRNARIMVERNKNDLYTFIQTELLPVLNSNVSSNLITLYQNLAKFNATFSNNLKKLDGTMQLNYDSLVAQRELITELQDLNINEISSANISLYREFKQSLGEFEKFQNYLSGLNSFIENTNLLNLKVSSVIDRTDDIGKIASSISDNVEQSSKLNKFLESHFSALENRGQLISNTVITLEDRIATSFEKLEEVIEEKIAAIRAFAIKEEDAMIENLTENSKLWKNLEELSEIKKILVEANKLQALNANRLNTQVVKKIPPSPKKSSKAQSHPMNFFAKLFSK